MFGLDMLDLAIGMCLFFLIVSLICSAVREAVETILKARARDLEQGMRELLADPSGETLMKSLMQHGQIAALFPGDYDPARLRDGWARAIRGPAAVLDYWKARAALPSYIPANQFATALMDVVTRGRGDWPYPVPAVAMTAATLREQAALLPSGRLQRAVLTAIDFGGNDLNRIKAELEAWFNGSMDRVSGHYKRRTQYWLFAIGLVTAALLNLDAVTVMNRLSNDPTMREAFVAQAAHVQTTGIGTPKTVEQMRGELAELNAPVGWVDGLPGPQSCTPGKAKGMCADERTQRRFDAGDWLAVILGWLVTAIAATIGAPFWFDLLNKFMVIRSTVKPREKSQDEGSEDRPLSKPAKPAEAPPPGGAPAAAEPVQPTQPAAPPMAAPVTAPPLATVDEAEDAPEAWREGFTNAQEEVL